ncbi:MAG: hypothetical protein [Bacteriophage sp.]|nr:MAG: hypothetical protein [Bacteriophage sp.]
MYRIRITIMAVLTKLFCNGSPLQNRKLILGTGACTREEYYFAKKVAKVLNVPFNQK